MSEKAPRIVQVPNVENRIANAKNVTPRAEANKAEPAKIELPQPVPPVEKTAEAHKPAMSQAAQEKATKTEKQLRPEEAFFENFFNKRNRDVKEVDEWFRSAKKNIEETEFNPQEKNKHLKKLKQLQETIESLPETSKTSRADRSEAERILKYLSDKNMIVIRDVEEGVGAAEASQSDMETGVTTPLPTETPEKAPEAVVEPPPADAPEAPSTTPPPPDKPKARRSSGRSKEPVPEGFKAFSDKFESNFNISEEQLMTIPGYKGLSFGQRALVQERFQQVLLGKIQEDASSVEQKTGGKASGVMGKWVEGAMKGYRVAELEKGIAQAASKGGIDAHRSTLEELVFVAIGLGDEASFDAEGNLNVSYVSEFKAENPKQEKEATRFDEAAARLSQIPAEWSSETATLPQRIKYATARRAYDKARENMLFMKEAQGGDALESALWMNKIDKRVRMDQLLSTHPEAKEELESIKDPTLWTKVFQNVGAERAAYFVGGGLSRLLSVSMFGAIAAPVVTGLAGGMKARSRAKEGLRESDKLARRGTKDKGEMAQNMIDVTKNKTAEKLDKLTDEIAKETDYKKRGVLVARLRERIKYTQDKLEDGKVSFGAFSERIKNQLDLSQALGRASVAAIENPEHAGKTYAEVLSRNVAAFMEKKDEAVDKKRAGYLNNTMVKGALISAGFGAAGRWASHFVFDGNSAHELVDSKGTQKVHLGGGKFGGAGASDGVEHGSSTIDAASTHGLGSTAVGAHELAGHGGKAAEGAVAALEIGKRGPEGSIIDYFKNNEDVAKKFGWDGKGDIKKWAGTKAHALWLEHTSKALESDEVKESLTKLGYTNDVEGYTKMMTRIKSGGVAIDIEHKGVTLSNMEYLKDRPVAAAASLEPEVLETLDVGRPPVADIETLSDTTQGESVEEEIVLHDAPVEEHAPGIPYDRDSGDFRTSGEGIPRHRDFEMSRIGYEGIPFDRHAGPFLDTSGMNLSQAVVERMNHDLTEVFGTTDEGQSEWPQWRNYGARRFLNLHVDAEQGHAAHLQGYLRDLEARSGLRPRAHILWFNQTVDQYIRRALKIIELRERS
ncbi:MAG: hypothetical protein KBD16_03875 [Candidatus Pacebacteria bacterium]|nr:hypothetical protein [Candidatus Paceibacterota bacterium]